AYTYIQVCNSTDGNATVRVWKTDSSYSNVLYPTGECTGDLYNGNNSVRVDTRNSESYKIKQTGGSYGPCHDHGIIDSDPPNNFQVYYKAYLFRSNCTL
ncbi:MAG TPA: hypothetical protein VJW23_19860, partial [Propionibacteriaceae bacterium]|nr:hypothetical protein [Propionibacteriaceae bacterium]